ncbi:MAG TPA: class I SAM-dependent methyltransferase [Vicinamibacterales bacterium]|nr:class I SAM-dependent methyltransferase [Vicinamibacterales bacterium]
MKRKLASVRSFQAPGVPGVPGVPDVPDVPDDGSAGWDEYAAFYDWENARTVGRRDVAFWCDVVARERRPVLELGCGTGRVLLPLARAGAAVTGLDRSAPMLACARKRARRLRGARRPALVRGDIRALPFARASFGVVLAPYGLLQSLIGDRAFDATLAEAARVLRRGGLLGIDLVPDLACWDEYDRSVRLRGQRRSGASVTLTEAVRQDRRRGLTIFDETFTERRGSTVRRRRFSLTFRTRSMRVVIRRLERAGFQIEALLGDYRGAPWDRRARVWIVLARRQ